jgi:aminoglycoside phosphotransferase (APT) family kinase protein
MEPAPDRPWEAERTVSAELARALIARACPGVEARRVELLGVGWDNTAYRVDGRWVFRFPRRTIAVEPIRTEAAVLPAIAEGLPLPVPVPVHVGEPSERFPWPFAGYELVPGRPASDVGLDEDARVAAAEPLARFLRALHDTPVTGELARALPGDTIGRLDLPMRRKRLEGRLARAVDAGLLRDASPFRAILEELPAGWTPRSDRIVHGDLYSRHVLVDEAGRPSGVIDWGDVHLGDPALDVSIGLGLLPAAGRDAFRRAYGAIDPESWAVARFRALSEALLTLVYGADVGDEALVREGRYSLGILREPDGPERGSLGS